MLLLALLPAAVTAQDGPDAAFSPPEICAACHGERGASTHPDLPIIGGLSAFVVEENLFAFRAAERPCRVTFVRSGEVGAATTSMCQLAVTLSDDDIINIAAYYAAQPFMSSFQQTDPDKVAIGAAVHHRECRHCHGEGGSDPADHASILAGQWMPYLTMELLGFRAGKRWMPRKMESKLQRVSDEEVAALVHYYGSRPGGAP